jgi:hypothetical protein
MANNLAGIVSNLPLSEQNFSFSGTGREGALPAINLVGDLTIDTGNFLGAKINTNGYSVTITGGNTRGLYLDNIKQDSFVWERKAVLPQVEALKAALKQGDGDAWEAWISAVEIVQAGAGSMTEVDFLSAFLTQIDIKGLVFDPSKYISKIRTILGNVSWTDFRDFVQSKSLGCMLGDETEVMETVS